MSNVALGYPDYVFANPAFATIAFSNGSWQAGAPLSNLGDPSFAAVARSTDLKTTSTYVTVDLGVQRSILVFAVPKHNLSISATYRFTAYSDTQGTVSLDAGWQPVYPKTADFNSLYWGDASLWSGQISAEDAPLYAMPLLYVAPAPINCRYWTIEMNDANNPAGYVELPRVFASAGVQPRVNMAYGGSLINEDNSVLQTTMGGAEFFDPRPRRRVARFTLPGLSDADSMTFAADMQTRLGITGQMFFVHDPADLTNRHRRSFLCRMRSLSALEYTAYSNYQQAFELSEVVA